MREKMKERESRSVGSIILVMRRSPANLSSSLVSPSSSPTHRDSTILSTFTPGPPPPVSVAGVDIPRDLVWKKEGGARLYCMAGLSVCPLFHMRCRCGDDIIVVSGWVVAGLSLCPFFFLSFFLFPLLLLFPWSPPVSCLLLPPASCLLSSFKSLPPGISLQDAASVRSTRAPFPAAGPWTLLLPLPPLLYLPPVLLLLLLLFPVYQVILLLCLSPPKSEQSSSPDFG